jgi:hypothetical protein
MQDYLSSGRVYSSSRLAYHNEWQVIGMASGKWDMKNWKQGEVSLLQALGISKIKANYPQLSGDNLPSQAQQSQNATGGATGGNTPPPSGGTEAQNAALGEEMAAAQPYNWTGAQWTALNNIVMAESGWNTTVANSSSGAYGIPQALPGSKMASAGADWQTNPRTQIKWMLQYIQQRYGDPITAWQWHLAHNWY